MKLDSTIDRCTPRRAEIARLGELGYALDFATVSGAARPNHKLREQTPHARCSFIHLPGSFPMRGGPGYFWRSHYVHHRLRYRVQR